MGKITVLEETTKYPLELIGQMAGIAYNTDTTDKDKNIKRAMSCIISEHNRVLEYPQVYLEIENYSAKVIREFGRHVGGMPTYLQASTRYIEYGDFKYVIPPKIDKDPFLRDRYMNVMYQISEGIKDLEAWGAPKEDASGLLPLNMCTKLGYRTNVRNIIDMAAQRLCNRAYWEYRDLMRNLITQLSNYSSEWATLMEFAKCKCDKVGYCCEEYSCGKYPKK